MILPQPAPEAPLRFGKYELLSPLSTSFFGLRRRVRLAQSGVSGTHALGHGADTTRTDQRALRIVGAETSEIIERIAHAATVARNAIHPALLSPVQIVRERGQIGIATNDVPGVTLRELMQRAMMRNEAIPQAVALRIALDVVAGLHALEVAVSAGDRATALYGGLTPDSILVGADGQTRLSDPGVQAAAARQAAWRDDLGLLAYTAPELTLHRERFDARVDVFSIGVIAWEMLSGQALFSRKTARETVAALHAASIARAQRVRFMRGEPVTAMVASALDRALQRDRDVRYRSYAELTVALRDAANAAGMQAVAAYVAGDRSASAPATEARGPTHASSTRAFGDERPTGKTAFVAAATFDANAPLVAGHPGEPTLEVVVDSASSSAAAHAAAHAEVEPQDVVATELDAPPFKPTTRPFTPWLIACAGVAMVAFATWLLASNASRTAAPRALRATLQEAPVTPRVEPAASIEQEPVQGTNPSTPTLAPELPAASTPARGAQPQAGTAPRFKAAAARTQSAKARKPEPKLFIPDDI